MSNMGGMLLLLKKIYKNKNWKKILAGIKLDLPSLHLWIVLTNLFTNIQSIKTGDNTSNNTSGFENWPPIFKANFHMEPINFLIILFWICVVKVWWISKTIITSKCLET